MPMESLLRGIFGVLGAKYPALSFWVVVAVGALIGALIAGGTWSSLAQQYKSTTELELLKQRLEASDAEKTRRRGIRERLAELLDEGERLKRRCITQTDLPPPREEAEEWATRVNEFLLRNLDRSYASRFANSPLVIVNQMGIPREHNRLWKFLQSKTEALTALIGELAD